MFDPQIDTAKIIADIFRPDPVVMLGWLHDLNRSGG